MVLRDIAVDSSSVPKPLMKRNLSGTCYPINIYLLLIADLPCFRLAAAYDDDILAGGGYLHPNDGLPASASPPARQVYLNEQFTRSRPLESGKNPPLYSLYNEPIYKS